MAMATTFDDRRLKLKFSVLAIGFSLERNFVGFPNTGFFEKLWFCFFVQEHPTLTTLKSWILLLPWRLSSAKPKCHHCH
ncbi:hypothetical protein TYRP_006924 [Tyrophagus putrescentiae]|nr:hypothetical protein TYRP_006924 [Tyrophagus putrescentiae]